MIRKRCAIYIRKSTEEGLEQDFNSLDAQREACAAYILSQKHEGWAERSERYDDGGFSGGSMDRPGLRQMLEDVRSGRIDIIVVYKVDRLTRSLADFAKMVDLFEGAGVSFVSVTQAFNTTSSMGRLTLNVLLSFAQFEREVTAERIRDKVAASKRKGMWMGGSVPMGYEVVDKALVVNEVEVTSIRTIFSEYLVLGCVRHLADRLKDLGIVSRRWTDRHGRAKGGADFSCGALYYILRNPVYIGRVRHKDALHEGLHQAIIDDATWRHVQTQLESHGGHKTEAVWRSASRMLDGLLFDSVGRPMRTTYSSKSVRKNGIRQSKRYWYYATMASRSAHNTKTERLPAEAIERVILNGLRARLADKRWMVEQASEHVKETELLADLLMAADNFLQNVPGDDGTVATQNVIELVDRIDVQKDRLRIAVNLQALLEGDVSTDPILSSFEIPFEMRQNGRAKPIIIAAEDVQQPDADLIDLIADARRWAVELLDGKATSIQQITDREGLRSGSVSRILPLAWLAPDISTAILEGRQPPHLNSKALRNLADLPLSWEEQRQILGFPPL